MLVINPLIFESVRNQLRESLRTLSNFTTKNIFEESNRLVDNAKESYFEILEEEKRTIRKSANPPKPNL